MGGGVDEISEKSLCACRVVSCRVVCRVVSCRVLSSCRVVLCVVCRVVSCRVVCVLNLLNLRYRRAERLLFFINLMVYAAREGFMRFKLDVDSIMMRKKRKQIFACFVWIMWLEC